MRITAIILFSGCLLVSTRGHSQTVSLDEKNTPLQKVFREIKKQTGFNFLYSLEQLEQAGPVSVEVRNATVEEAVSRCLQSKLLGYSIVEKTVIIKRKEIPKTFKPVEKSAVPPVDVQGRVVNEKGEGMVVTVAVKGTLNAVSTNANGYFTLKGVDENAVLVISGVTIENFEWKLNGKTQITLTAKTKVATQDEVTVEVNTGYQRLPKERATGSFVKVDNELLNRAVGINILNRLDGVTPSLLFDKRNPQKTRLQLRGLYTLNISTSNQPLIILDNFPFEGDINAINPNDVQDITILRDAAATSVWGARAGNGVIVITTKKGRINQKTQVSVNSSVNITDKPDLFSLPMLPATEGVEIERYLFDRGYFDADINSSNHIPLTPAVEILLKRRTGQISSAEADKQLDILKGYDIRNDYLKYLLQRAVLQSHSASFSTGGNNYGFLFSAGYDKNRSNTIGNNNDRLNFRVQNTYKPIDKMTMQLGIQYAMQTAANNGLKWGDVKFYGINPPMYTRFADDEGNPLGPDLYYRGGYIDTLGGGKLLDWRFRPLDEIKYRDNTIKQQTIIATFGTRYEITRTINGEVNYQYEKTNSEERLHNSLQTYYTRDLINRFTNLNINNNIALRYPVPMGDILDMKYITLEAHNARGQVNYNQKFQGNDHQVAAIAGVEIRQRRQFYNSYRAYGFSDRLNSAAVDNITRYPLITGGSANIPQVNGVPFAGYLNRFVSIYGNTSYTYKGRYILSASGRKDASNIFGVNTNQKGRPFWSAGAAWIISEETFYKLPALPRLKLRITYGYNGNIDPSVSALTLITNSSAFYNTLTNLPAAGLAGLPNPNLRWERVGQLNMAIDFRLKNDIISGNIEYYIKKSTDVIGSENIDPTAGRTAIRSNSADMKGNGIDIALNSKNINTNDLKWTTDFSFSSARFKVTKYKIPIASILSGASFSNGTYVTAVQGLNPFEVISLPWGGLNPLNGLAMGKINGKTFTSPDSVIYSTISDLVYHGSNVPLYFGNIMNTISFRGFTVSANITYRLGYYFRKPTVSYFSLIGNNGVGNADYQKRWKQPGDEKFTNVPAFVYPSSIASFYSDILYSGSETLVEKGDHVRLENIRLSYNMAPNGHKRPLFRQITVYAILSDMNVLIWKANKAGLDPDFAGTFKTPASIAFGLNANF